MSMGKGISTQIRNFYSEQQAYLSIRYYNTSLSFQIFPFMGNDSNNKPIYDMKSSLTTTVGFENAYALYKTCEDIVEGRVQEVSIKIPCMGGASVLLERKLNQNNIFETILTINKNDKSVSFKFLTILQQIKENGVPSTKIVESGVGAFMLTLAGYLVSINAGKHLDKVMAAYEKRANDNNQSQGNNNAFKKNFNSNNNSFNQSNGFKQQDFTSFNPMN